MFTQEQCCRRNFPLQPVTAVAPESRSTSVAAGCCFFFQSIFLTFCLFIFWLLWGSQAFSSCGEQGLLSKMRCLGFSLQWLLLLWSMGSMARRLSRLEAVESSQTRDWTHVPYTGGRTLNHWTTREVQKVIFLWATVASVGGQTVVSHTHANQLFLTPFFLVILWRANSIGSGTAGTQSMRGKYVITNAECLIRCDQPFPCASENRM